jgi:hypothetical protein
MMLSRLAKLFINECDKHLMRLNHAAAKMVLFMPLNVDRYLALSEDEIEHLDQFLFRFAKLKDTIGEKLLISILEYLQEENPKFKPFIDILNRLEQLESLEEKNNWLELRKIRNNISHQYEDEPKQASEALNEIYNAKPMLETIYLSLKRRYTFKLRLYRSL